VIADYPNSVYTIGEIIECVSEEDCTLHRWPAVFQPLQWWEERTLEEMPLYVKCVKTPDQRIMPGRVLKVVWKDPSWGREGEATVLPYTNCYLPATEEQYNAYMSEKQAV